VRQDIFTYGRIPRDEAGSLKVRQDLNRSSADKIGPVQVKQEPLRWSGTSTVQLRQDMTSVGETGPQQVRGRPSTGEREPLQVKKDFFR
jgi:hypothetical protein